MSGSASHSSKGPLLAAAISFAGLAACGDPGIPPNQVQGLVSPDGEWTASAPIEGDPGVWVVTIEDSTGRTVFRDTESGFCGNLNVYWLWDSRNRLWLWNSDDGRTWIYHRFGGEWRAGLWKEGGMADLVLGDAEPPDGLVPEYSGSKAVPSIEASPGQLVLADSGSWFAYRVELPPVCLEIPALGESLRSHAVEGLRGFLELAGESGPASGTGMSSQLDLLHLAEYSEEPSPEGLVCVSMEGFEFFGGAHGITWHRAFIYDTGTGGGSSSRCLSSATPHRARSSEPPWLTPSSAGWAPRTTG